MKDTEKSILQQTMLSSITEEPKAWMHEALRALETKAFGFVKSKPAELPPLDLTGFKQAYTEWNDVVLFGEMYDYASKNREFPEKWTRWITAVIQRFRISRDLWDKIMNDEANLGLIDFDTHAVYSKDHKISFKNRIKILFTGKFYA